MHALDEINAMLVGFVHQTIAGGNCTGRDHNRTMTMYQTINGMSHSELLQVMWDLHARMERCDHKELLQLSDREYAAVMTALEVAGDM